MLKMTANKNKKGLGVLR